MPWRKLHESTRRLLVDGDTDGTHANHSGGVNWPKVLCALALRFRNHGRSENEFVDAVTNPSHAASVWYQILRRKRGRQAAEQWLRRRWYRAGRRPLPHRGVDPDKVEAFVNAAIQQQRWAGKAGATDRTVLLAHARFAVRFGRDYAAGCRDLAQAADVTRTTAARATRRLVARGLLELVKPDKGPQAAVYRLRLVAVGCTNVTQPSPPRVSPKETGTSVSLAFTGHDLFRWSALGCNARALYDALSDAQADVRTLAVLGMHASTVRRNLRRLADYGLAVQIEHGGWRRGGGDLDAAAHAEGTLGAGARTRDRHAAERALWRERLVRLGLDQSGVSVQGLSDGRVVDRFTGEVLGRIVDPALEDVPLPEEPAA